MFGEQPASHVTRFQVTRIPRLDQRQFRLHGLGKTRKRFGIEQTHHRITLLRVRVEQDLTQSVFPVVLPLMPIHRVSRPRPRHRIAQHDQHPGVRRILPDSFGRSRIVEIDRSGIEEPRAGTKGRHAGELPGIPRLSAAINGIPMEEVGLLVLHPKNVRMQRKEVSQRRGPAFLSTQDEEVGTEGMGPQAVSGPIGRLPQGRAEFAEQEMRHAEPVRPNPMFTGDSGGVPCAGPGRGPGTRPVILVPGASDKLSATGSPPTNPPPGHSPVPAAGD